MTQSIKPETVKKKQSFKVILIFFIIFLIGFFIQRSVFGVSVIRSLNNSNLIFPLNKYLCELEGGYYISCNVIGLPPYQHCGCNEFTDVSIGKPVIYLYPQKITDVNIEIKYSPGFSVTYPEYNDGWKVRAYPNSKIINKSDGLEYSYLYWEGNPDSNANYDFSTGFIVKGEDTAVFLQKKLSEMGLIPKEYNEFIVYWLPKMKSNPYNLIHFASKSEYIDRVKMEINPEPDSVLRILMVYKPLDNSINIKPQSFPQFIRRGFSVVEWGGSKLN